jgi:hypothetical protein
VSTFTDGAPPSVTPGPDDVPGTPTGGSDRRSDHGSSDPDGVSASGSAWLSEEIQRRIAAGRGGIGRHARRTAGGTSGTTGYVPRHSVPPPAPAPVGPPPIAPGPPLRPGTGPAVGPNRADHPVPGAGAPGAGPPYGPAVAGPGLPSRSGPRMARPDELRAVPAPPPDPPSPPGFAAPPVPGGPRRPGPVSTAGAWNILPADPTPVAAPNPTPHVGPVVRSARPDRPDDGASGELTAPSGTARSSSPTAVGRFDPGREPASTLLPPPRTGRGIGWPGAPAAGAGTDAGLGEPATDRGAVVDPGAPSGPGDAPGVSPSAAAVAGAKRAAALRAIRWKSGVAGRSRGPGAPPAAGGRTAPPGAPPAAAPPAGATPPAGPAAPAALSTTSTMPTAPAGTPIGSTSTVTAGAGQVVATPGARALGSVPATQPVPATPTPHSPGQLPSAGSSPGPVSASGPVPSGPRQAGPRRVEPRMAPARTAAPRLDPQHPEPRRTAGASTIVAVPTQRGSDQLPLDAELTTDLQRRRVRVVLAERKGVARPVRTVVDIQEGTGVGELLRSNLIGSQLAVALRFAVGAGLTLGVLPLLFALFPEIGQIDVLGLRLPWLLLGLLVYPFLLGLGWWHTLTAERVEQDFADHVQD